MDLLLTAEKESAEREGLSQLFALRNSFKSAFRQLQKALEMNIYNEYILLNFSISSGSATMELCASAGVARQWHSCC